MIGRIDPASKDSSLGKGVSCRGVVWGLETEIAHSHFEPSQDTMPRLGSVALGKRNQGGAADYREYLEQAGGNSYYRQTR